MVTISTKHSKSEIFYFIIFLVVVTLGFGYVILAKPYDKTTDYNSHAAEMSTPNTWSVAAGPILASPLVLLSLVSKGRWMGWGDGPLELSLGFLLGLSAGGTALMLAFWIGAAVGILLMVFKKGLTMKSELPFAPFLVAGALVVHFFHVDFFSTLPFLW
jgi:prepilin signal peptidase PulO-like enzyme (type II secretory pathway)